jgi:CheY-like chemotaxis protein
MIFLTSNLGAKEMMRELTPTFGFAGATAGNRSDTAAKLQGIALSAVRKRFSPEFVNRIDAIITYQPLGVESLAAILEHQITELQDHVNNRLGARRFDLEVTEPAKQLLLDRGTSVEYGARELKRTVHRFLTQPLATLVAESRIDARSRVVVGVEKDGAKLTLEAVSSAKTAPSAPVNAPSASSKPRILIVDDNVDLLNFLKKIMKQSEWDIFTAETAGQALAVCAKNRIDVALMDYVLPDLDGVQLSRQLSESSPSSQIIIMTGGEMSSDREEICRKCNVPIIQKPFLVEDVLGLVRSAIAASLRPTAFTASQGVR